MKLASWVNLTISFPPGSIDGGASKRDPSLSDRSTGFTSGSTDGSSSPHTLPLPVTFIAIYRGGEGGRSYGMAEGAKGESSTGFATGSTDGSADTLPLPVTFISGLTTLCLRMRWTMVVKRPRTREERGCDWQWRLKAVHISCVGCCVSRSGDSVTSKSSSTAWGSVHCFSCCFKQFQSEF